MSFGTEIYWFNPGVERVLSFLVNKRYKLGDIHASYVTKDTGTGEGVVQFLEIWVDET